MTAAKLTFRPRHRLAHQRQFDAVYGAKVQRASGPLVVHGAPNGLAHHRLGLSIGRRIGTAVARNRVKRMIRDAFRHVQHEVPEGDRRYDLVVSMRPHDPMPAAEYRRRLRDLITAIDRDWKERSA